jgi:hypothetical protein
VWRDADANDSNARTTTNLRAALCAIQPLLSNQLQPSLHNRRS